MSSVYTMKKYFTVPHIVHWTLADSSGLQQTSGEHPSESSHCPPDSSTQNKKMTRLACPVIVHWTSGRLHQTSTECPLDNDQKFARFCINFNEFIYYHISNSFIHIYIYSYLISHIITITIFVNIHYLLYLFVV